METINSCLYSRTVEQGKTRRPESAVQGQWLLSGGTSINYFDLECLLD